MKTPRLLNADEIEVKVKQVTEKGVIALLYKTARTDMAILDETFGAQNWSADYKEVKGNMYCGIGVREEGGHDFVWKWNCGTESRADDDGNEKKGEASDAFKRAGTLWGIGRELYTSPFIFIKAETELNGRTYKLKDRYATYSVRHIGYDAKRNISELIIVDKFGVNVFNYSQGFVGRQPTQQDVPKLPTPVSNIDIPEAPAEVPAPPAAAVKGVKGERARAIIALVQGTSMTWDRIYAWIYKRLGKSTNTLDDLSEDEYVMVYKALAKQVTNGSN